MADPFQNFVDQYKENCDTYVRRAPVKLLGLVLAFPAAIGLAAAGALLARFTGEPLAAGVVIFVGAIAYLVGWILVARMLDRPSPAQQPAYQHGPYPPPLTPVGQSPFASAPSYPPSFVDAQFSGIADPAPWQQPLPATPARSGSGGCVLAALGTFAILVLSCCGGGIFLSRFAAVPAGPPNRPFQAGAPFGNAPFGHDPFADMQRRQQRQLDDMLERQRDQWREIERDRQRSGPGPGW